MKLLIVRHGVAEDRELFSESGKKDELRPLTERGRKKTRKNFEGLKYILPHVDLIASSPYVRAFQTAEICADVYRKKNIYKIKELEPDAPFKLFLDWLLEHKTKEVVAIIGHEPHLSFLTSKLLSHAESKSFLLLKKGGVGLLEFIDKVQFGKGQLVFWLPPRILRS
ncbi:MAG: phosphohistidine phosphatase SixA [Deltaproteobacteria bacterium]|nr:phosphohistidine phosphatase SixA [Deltaproteobacteria bacterium]